jgi:hypothetical protein
MKSGTTVISSERFELRPECCPAIVIHIPAVQFLVHIKQSLEDPAWMLVAG